MYFKPLIGRIHFNFWQEVPNRGLIVLLCFEFWGQVVFCEISLPVYYITVGVLGNSETTTSCHLMANHCSKSKKICTQPEWSSLLICKAGDIKSQLQWLNTSTLAGWKALSVGARRDGCLRSESEKNVSTLCLTGHAGDAQHVGVAHVELVHQRARLVGVYDDHLAGRVGAGEDPHPAAHGVRLLELLGLEGDF